jgi:phospholipid-binding lipoprotein MlaA
VKHFVLLIAALLAMSACASTRDQASRIGGAAGDLSNRSLEGFKAARDQASQSIEDGLIIEEGALVADPFEGFNRRMFAINAQLDQFALGPASQAYGEIVPLFGRRRVRDFIDNVKTPVWFANDMLQGDLSGAGVQLGRFTLNTTFGLAGLFDVAAAIEPDALRKVDEDFGQTLGVWGMGQGPYLVLPFLGPSTTRDLLGRVVDTGLDPLNHLNFDGVAATRVSFRAADVVDLRYQVDDVFAVLEAASDPYVQARTYYVQARQRRIREAGTEEDFGDLPDL